MDDVVGDLGGSTFQGPDEKGIGTFLLEVDLNSVEFRPPLVDVLAADLDCGLRAAGWRGERLRSSILGEGEII